MLLPDSRLGERALPAPLPLRLHQCSIRDIRPVGRGPTSHGSEEEKMGEDAGAVCTLNERNGGRSGRGGMSEAGGGSSEVLTLWSSAVQARRNAEGSPDSCGPLCSFSGRLRDLPMPPIVRSASGARRVPTWNVPSPSDSHSLHPSRPPRRSSARGCRGELRSSLVLHRAKAHAGKAGKGENDVVNIGSSGPGALIFGH
jgi:hypothetical protein